MTCIGKVVKTFLGLQYYSADTEECYLLNVQEDVGNANCGFDLCRRKSIVLSGLCKMVLN